jgi:hypothetical protein
MVTLSNVDLDILESAVLEWTGYGKSAFPKREASALDGLIPSNEKQTLLSVIDALEEDFHSSDAHLTAPSLEAMGENAAHEFREKYPDLPDKISQAFAWCYTFDYK